MSFLPLTLGIGRGLDAGGGGSVTRADAERALKRDDFTCRFCGFRAVQYQRVVPTADGPVTACAFCEQVVALDRAGVMGGGILIWLPEITQAELNHIVRAIYVARDGDDRNMEQIASRALEALTARRVEAKKRLGSDDPMLLATVLHEHLQNAERDGAAAKLEGIRLLPADKHIVRSRSGDLNAFPQILKFWRSPQGPFAKLPVGEWQGMFKKVAA